MCSFNKLTCPALFPHFKLRLPSNYPWLQNPRIHITPTHPAPVLLGTQRKYDQTIIPRIVTLLSSHSFIRRKETSVSITLLLLTSSTLTSFSLGGRCHDVTTAVTSDQKTVLMTVKYNLARLSPMSGGRSCIWPDYLRSMCKQMSPWQH